MSLLNFGFSICDLIFLTIIVVVYFTKPRIKSVENKIYSKIIITNITGILIDIVGFFIFQSNHFETAFKIYVSKLYLIYYYAWYSFVTFYVLEIYKKQSSKSSTSLYFKYVILFIINSMIIYVLPLSLEFNTLIPHPVGPAVIYTYLMASIFIGLIVISVIKNSKNVARKKQIPIFCFMIFGTMAMIIQFVNSDITLLLTVHTLVTTLMYFTLENPDVKLLEEFKIAKDRAEKANKEKELFLYNITQDIRIPLSNIKKASTWINNNLDEIKKNDIKDGMYYIDNNASNILDKVNNVLDITNMEITNIKVYNTKYNVKLLLDELYKVYNKKIDKNIKLRFNIDSNIPELLNGDSLRLKQLLTIILDNSVKYTDKGFIELNLNTIVKKDVCRLVISIEDSGCGIKASEIDEIFNKENQNYNNLDKIDDSKKNLAIAKSISTLLGGILMLESEIGSGTEVTLVLDQKIYDEKSDELKKLEKEVSSYIDKKKVMVVSEDIEYLDSLVKKLSKYDIEIEKIDLGSKCLEKIRLNKVYDLIIIDELLNHLSALDILNKLKSIKTFNIDVAILTDNVDNKNYLKDGFNYILNRKIDKKELDNLINGIDK